MCSLNIQCRSKVFAKWHIKMGTFPPFVEWFPIPGFCIGSWTQQTGSFIFIRMCFNQNRLLSSTMKMKQKCGETRTKENWRENCHLKFHLLPYTIIENWRKITPSNSTPLPFTITSYRNHLSRKYFLPGLPALQICP